MLEVNLVSEFSGCKGSQAEVFLDDHLFFADIGAGCSFLWQSLIWGRELLEAGSRWRIGNGERVSIYQDRWIPRPADLRIISPPVLGDAATVSMLKLPSNMWDEVMIRGSFFKDDAIWSWAYLVLLFLPLFCVVALREYGLLFGEEWLLFWLQWLAEPWFLGSYSGGVLVEILLENENSFES